MRTQIPGNAEFATAISKAIAFKIGDLAVMAGMPFGVDAGEGLEEVIERY